MVEHIVYSSIANHLERNNILTPSQHGFRPGHSCETQLISAVDDWSKAINNGDKVDISILDFSKAFDRCHTNDLNQSYTCMASAIKPYVG